MTAKRLEYHRQWRAKNPEKVKEACRKWREAHPSYYGPRSKRYRATHPGTNYKYSKKWHAENKEAARVHQKVKRAVKAGKLTRQPCRDCDNPNTHAHHTDYTKPFDVIWLCAVHHIAEHTQLRRKQTI